MVRLEVWFGLMVVVTIGTGLVPLCRFYALRNKKRNQLSLASDFLFGFCSIYALHNAIYLTYVIKRQINLLHRGLTQDVVALTIFQESLGKFAVATGFGYILEIWALKTCFVLFYWHLYRRTDDWRRRFLYITAVAVQVIVVVEIVLYWTACIPVKWQWSIEVITEKGGKQCTSSASLVVQVFIGATSIATDLMILLLGLLILRALKLSRIDNYAVAFVILIGALSMCSTVARLAVLNATHAIYDQTGSSAPHGTTLTQTDAIIFLSCLEIVAGQLAFSLPSFRFLLRPDYLKSLWTRMTRWTNPSSSGGRSSGNRDVAAAAPDGQGDAPPTIGTKPMRGFFRGPANKPTDTELSGIEMGVLPDISSSQEQLKFPAGGSQTPSTTKDQTPSIREQV